MKILVTGGTGTIGRMICRRLVDQGHDVVVLSRDPARQFVNCPNMTCEIGRIEDEYLIRHIFHKHEIEGVIHTAANKHIGICENRPTEAVDANIVGSWNILKAIEESKVRRAVFVSSDKACNHEHVYGITKYLMEKLVAEYAERIRHARLNCVRFGNVFGSSGSVVPIWQSKINQGQDIDLRVFEDGQMPLRIALLPSDAANFCIEVLFGDDWTSGSILLRREMNMLSLRTLAEVMVEGTRSKINEVPAMPMEAANEKMYTKQESDRIISHEKAMEITSRLTGDRPGRHRGHGEFMDKEDTMNFLAKVKEEVKGWI